MEQISPFTRKVVAIGLLILLVISIVNLALVPLVTGLSDRLDQLENARLRRARLEMLEATAPLPSIATPRSSLVFRAATPAQAIDGLANLSRDLASRTGATAELSAPTSGGSAISADLVAGGSERAVLEFINQLERNEPMVRFARWKLAALPDSDGQVRLDARVIAAWGMPE